MSVDQKRGECFLNCVSFDKSGYTALKKGLTDADRTRESSV